MHMYATTKELKKKAFRVKRQNIKWAIGIQVTFISENKHKNIFYQNTTIFLANYASIFHTYTTT